MTFAFLPNYFKKIGLVCFALSIAVIVGATVYAMVYYAAEAGGELTGDASFEENYRFGRAFAASNYWVVQVSSIPLLLSMAFYMLAKEKVDDEYMDAIRWESLRLAVIVGILTAVVFVIVGWQMPAKAILFIQFITYLITFKIKKRS